MGFRLFCVCGNGFGCICIRGATMTSLRRRTPDADIKHYYSVINATMY